MSLASLFPRLALLSLLVCASSPAQRDIPRELGRLLAAKRAADEIPGVSCAAWIGDEIVFAQGLGESDVENGVAATEHTVYRLASISKSVTAVLAMQLVERGRLDLDRDLSEVVPGWPEKRWPVTTRQLLGHLGGVRHYRGEGESTRRFPDQRASLGRFARDPLVHQPGTRYRYTTYGFNLIAAAVETLHDAPFHRLVAERVAAVAAAPTLQDDDQRRIIPHRAQGYVRFGEQLSNSRLMDSSYKLGGGGLCSSAPDLARFGQALLAAKYVSRETLRQMWTSQHTSGGAATGYGMGFRVGELDGALQVGHTGAQSRVSTTLQMLPESGVGVVILCNLEGVKFSAVAQEMLRRLRAEATR
ncbi:MAG: serine hydrolase domain-containing protein [Planctomycetota bacterium]